jgi:hypothetical protein
VRTILTHKSRERFLSILKYFFALTLRKGAEQAQAWDSALVMEADSDQAKDQGRAVDLV